MTEHVVASKKKRITRTRKDEPRSRAVGRCERRLTRSTRKLYQPFTVSGAWSPKPTLCEAVRQTGQGDLPHAGARMIRVAELSVQFGVLTALDSVTLAFRRGETAVLLGRSGAGKSTLLRCSNYLQLPTRGSVEVEGLGSLNQRRHLRQHRRNTGAIFQLHHLLNRQTALKNVLMGRLGYHATLRTLFPFSRTDTHLALECLDSVGLLHKALCRVDQLSGGERQRVGIARASASSRRLSWRTSRSPASTRRRLSRSWAISVRYAATSS